MTSEYKRIAGFVLILLSFFIYLFVAVYSKYNPNLVIYFNYIAITGCYVAVLVAMWKYLDNLYSLHFDFWSLLFLVVSGTIFGFQTGIKREIYFQVIIWIASLGILYFLVKYRNKIPKTNFYWIPITLFGSLATSLIIAEIESTQPQLWLEGSAYITKNVLLVFLRSFLYQFSSIAVAEEFIFRGFLWYYLYSLGWDNNKVFWGQAIIFWLFHASSIVSPITFFIVIPIGTLLFSLLVKYSKQLFPSILAHTLVNSLTNLFLYILLR
jgi:membrane protease YdiL (CAAX protease family)